jgi:hypothetical protein
MIADRVTAIRDLAGPLLCQHAGLIRGDRPVQAKSDPTLFTGRFVAVAETVGDGACR